MRLTTLRLAAVAVLALLVTAAARPVTAGSGYVVVVHAESKVRAVSRPLLSSIFLKQRANWEDGSLAQPVDQPEQASARDAFSKDVHRRSVAAVRAYWQQQIFGGRLTPPPTRQGDAEVLSWVRKTPGAVGYVSSAAVAGAGVRVVDVRD